MAKAEERRPEAEEAAAEAGSKDDSVFNNGIAAKLSIHCAICKSEITKVVLCRKVRSYSTNTGKRESNHSATTNHLDVGDAYKNGTSTIQRQFSVKLLGQNSFKDSFNSNGITGMQSFQYRTALERKESNISLDGSVVSEIEGESEVDRLKRKVEHLYKKLEKERSTSADGIDSAMAMITKLQEEKAALHTKALDMYTQALKSAKVIIEEKERQIQDLKKLLEKTYEC